MKDLMSKWLLYILKGLSSILTYKYIILVLLIWLEILYNINYINYKVLLFKTLYLLLILLWLYIYKKVIAYIRSIKEKENIWKKLNEWEYTHKAIEVMLYIYIYTNPILYIIWKYDICMYKIKIKINEYIKNKKYNAWITLLLYNVTNPIKFVYWSWYKSLWSYQENEYKKIMMCRIDILVLNIIIISNIMQYIIKIAGGYVNLIIILYVILYVIDVYVLWWYFTRQYVVKTEKNAIIEYYYSVYLSQDIKELYIEKSRVSILGVLLVQIISNWMIYNKENRNKLKRIPHLFSHYIYHLYENYMNWIFWNVVDYKLWYERWCLAEFSYRKHKFINNFNLDKNTLLYYFYSNIKNFSADHVFINFTNIISLKYQTYKPLTVLEMQDYYKLYQYYILVIKVLVYFCWDLEYQTYKDIDINKINKINVVKDMEQPNRWLFNDNWEYLINKQEYNESTNWEVNIQKVLNIEKLPYIYNINKKENNIYFEFLHLMLRQKDTLNYKLYNKENKILNQNIQNINIQIEKYLNKETKYGEPIIWALDRHYDQKMIDNYFIELELIINNLFLEWDLDKDKDVNEKHKKRMEDLVLYIKKWENN